MLYGRYLHGTATGRLLGLSMLAGVSCADVVRADGYVGAVICAGCHQEAYQAWQGTHHDLAMQKATPATVLGDFDDAAFSHDGITTAFHRQDSRYVVRTEGQDGNIEEFAVAYTFGAEPLQQYLIETDGGRYQALTVAWDNRPATEGGQRWFDLQPDTDPAPGDPDHWTGRHYNWNSQCAGCHSTGLVKGYDPATRSYDTTFAEIDVACESCHGPGHDHVDWAENEARSATGDKGLKVRLGGRGGGWILEDGEAIAHWEDSKQEALRSTNELESCAPCHARRQELTTRVPAGAAFLDHYLPALLDPGLYHADGQIDDEVFVWGSFQQSKMHQAGVICSDCHDPHSLETRAPGNNLCGQCHRPAIFDRMDHHRHDVGSEGALCVNCHMPAKTYMVIDPRRDHSFRIPRPDLAETLNIRDACSSCHEDRGPTWAASVLDGWFGTDWRDRPSFAQAFRAGWQDENAAEPDLLRIVRDRTMAPIVRATALSYLAGYPNAVLETDLSRDPSPLIRLGAARAPFSQATIDEPAILEALLTDNVLAVRLEAARSLGNLPEGTLPNNVEIALQKATEELIDALGATADWPETQLTLGNLHVAKDNLDAAEDAYREALDLDPSLSEATVNLATLYQQTARDGEALALLKRSVRSQPESDTIRFALGLAFVRQGDPSTALAHLRNAAELAPDVAQYAYAYGVGLHSTGQSQQALTVLEAAVNRHPSNQKLLYMLATVERDRGNFEAALGYASKLKDVAPTHPYIDPLLRELQAATER